jgi:glutamate/tyrosine decarboxylase-like PLP-dependent enzyme
MDLGPELTRPFRALKLWMSLKVFGADAFARAIEHGFDMAEHAERILRTRPHWEIASPAGMAIVAFRYVHPALDESELDALNRSIADLAAADGCCFASTTVLRGRTVLRFCTIQPTTTPEDLQVSIECLERAARQLTAR